MRDLSIWWHKYQTLYRWNILIFFRVCWQQTDAEISIRQQFHLPSSDKWHKSHCNVSPPSLSPPSHLARTVLPSPQQQWSPKPDSQQTSVKNLQCLRLEFRLLTRRETKSWKRTHKTRLVALIRIHLNRPHNDAIHPQKCVHWSVDRLPSTNTPVLYAFQQYRAICLDFLHCRFTQAVSLHSLSFSFGSL